MLLPVGDLQNVSSPSDLLHNPARHLLAQRQDDVLLQPRKFSHTLDTTSLYSPGQILAIQLAAGIVALISLLGSLLALYWFAMMRKKFRHRLIIILVVADTFRSAWLFVFPMVYIAQNGINSASALCQASGFFTQTGYEMADCAVLAIAIHTAMQVFSPRPYSRSESGLYQYRQVIYPLCILLPFLLAGLAFIRHEPAYLAQGPVCSLPIRPYWYRLALSWIPRYVVMATIVILYTAIYVHVALQFGSMHRLFGRQDSILDTLEPDRDDGVQFDVTSDASRRHSVLGPATRHASVRAASLSHSLVAPRDISALDPRASSSRNQSGDTTLVDGSSDRFDFASTFPVHQQHQQQQQQPEQHRDEDKSDKGKSDFAVFEHSALANSMFPPADTDGCLDARTGRRLSTPRRPSRVVVPLPLMRAAADDGADDILMRRIVTPAMRAKRAAIQRQLRLLFAYPLCYILTWLLPLVQHGLNYSNHFAQHPVFAVTMLAYLSLAAMGAMDALVFAWREKPWRLIPGADGSFLSSLRPWSWRGDALPEPVDRTGSYASTTATTWPASPGHFTPRARPSRRASALDAAVNGSGDDGNDAPLPALVDAGGLLAPPPAFSRESAAAALTTSATPPHARRPSSSAIAHLAALPGLAPLTEEDLHDADAHAHADAALGSLRTWSFACPYTAASRAVAQDKPPAQQPRRLRRDWFERRLSRPILRRKPRG